MIIELIGLPGSGKTTIAEKTKKELGIEVSDFKSGITKFLGAMKFIYLHPATSAHLFFWTVKLNSGRLSLLKHKVFFLLFSAMAREGSSSSRSLIDEGLIQFLCAISDRKLSNDEVLKIVRGLKIREREVWLVTCSEKERIDRINRRERLPRSYFGKEYTDNFYKSLAFNYPMFADALSKRFKLRTINN